MSALIINRWFIGWALALPLLLLFTIKGVASKNETNPQANNFKQTVKVLRIPAVSSDKIYEFAGQLSATDRAGLTFQVDGQIEQLHVKLGERVKQGQLLASLDKSDYQLAVSARQAEYDLARLKADQALQLYKKNLVSEDFYDQSQTRLTSSLALLEQAKTDLDRCDLKAPFDGEISYRFARPHQVVSSHQPILNLQRSDLLHASFDLPNSLSRKLSTKNSPKFEVTVYHLSGIRFKGVIDEISSAPDPNTNSYRVNLLIQKPDDSTLMPGLTAKIIMTAPGQPKDDIRIPQGAILKQTDSLTQVWRINEESQVTAVEINLDENGYLVNGLNAGDLIVSAGANQLQENQPVIVWKREGGI